MKLTVVNYAWIKHWWSKNWKYICFNMGIILVFTSWVICTHMNYPTNYIKNSKVGTVIEKCSYIERLSIKRFDVGIRGNGSGFVYDDYIVIYMGNGERYYLFEDYEDIFDINKLEKNFENKVLTIQYLQPKKSIGYQLLSVQDQFGYKYLSIEDVEDKHSSILIKTDIICGILIAIGVVFLNVSCWELYDHIRCNMRRRNKKKHRQEQKLIRQQRLIEDPECFKNIKNKKKK